MQAPSEVYLWRGLLTCFTSFLSSYTLPAQRFELWTLKLRVSCSTKLSYTGDFQDLSCNAPDVIRTRDIRVKSPLPYRLATDANQYSVFGISPSVFVLFFSLSLTPFLFFFFICPRHLCREHQLMRRGLNPQTLRLITPRLRRSRYQITAALRLPITADRATYLHNALNFYFTCSF